MLSRDDIIKAVDIETEIVEVPEWGGQVMVKGLTGTERDAFEASVVEMRGKTQKVNMKNVRAKLCAMTICDEKSDRLFTDADVAVLGSKSATALNRVFEVASRLSGLSAEDVEALEKNSDTGVDDSTSG